MDQRCQQSNRPTYTTVAKSQASSTWEPQDDPSGNTPNPSLVDLGSPIWACQKGLVQAPTLLASTFLAVLWWLKISTDQPPVKVAMVTCRGNERTSLTPEPTSLLEVIMMCWRDARLAWRSRLGSLVVNVSFAFAHRYEKAVWEMYVGLVGNWLKAC